MAQKRYMAFAWDVYYPAGASNEHFGFFDTLEEALEFLPYDTDHLELYDTHTDQWKDYKLRGRCYD